VFVKSGLITHRGDVTTKPLPVPIGLPETEQGLEVVLESKVERLSREVSAAHQADSTKNVEYPPDDIGGVTSPQGSDTLLVICSAETVPNAFVRGSETSLLDPENHQIKRLLEMPRAYISSWFWTKSLIRSMGAAAVLATAADTPPIRKSVMKDWKSLGF